MSAASFCKKQIRWKAAISDVQVLSHSETLGISDPAIEQIPAAIVAANSADVDIVSGATNTSRGIIAAVKNAMGAEAAVEEPAGKVLQNDVYERRDDMDAEKSSEIYYGGVAARQEKYAPVVRTLENGVKVQRTPYDAKAFNNKYYRADSRGCGACHEDLAENLRNIEDFQQDGNGGWAHTDMRNELGIDITYNQCYVCHYENAYTHEFSTVIHATHEDSEAFKAMGGDCWSCHFVDEKSHELVFWDLVKYDYLAGITLVSDVQGDFSYDQDTLTTDIFSLNSTYSESDKQRLFTHFAGIDPDPEHDGIYEQWESTVDGAVENPTTFTMKELIDNAPSVTDIGSYMCEINGFGGPLMENFEFTGIPLSWVLEQVRPTPEANNLMMGWRGGYGFDYLEKFPAYLVYKINGEPLSYFNGYPVLLYIDDGFAGHDTQQVTHIEIGVLDEPGVPGIPGHQTADGTWINMPCVGICYLKNGQILPQGEAHTFEGYAHACQLGIESVEISFDRGKTWTKLDTSDSKDGRWAYWRFTWQSEATGSYIISVRATSKAESLVSLVNELLFNVQ